jgi:hypothetical protein
LFNQGTLDAIALNSERQILLKNYQSNICQLFRNHRAEESSTGKADGLNGLFPFYQYRLRRIPVGAEATVAHHFMQFYQVNYTKAGFCEAFGLILFAEMSWWICCRMCAFNLTPKCQRREAPFNLGERWATQQQALSFDIWQQGINEMELIEIPFMC